MAQWGAANLRSSGSTPCKGVSPRAPRLGHNSGVRGRGRGRPPWEARSEVWGVKARGRVGTGVPPWKERSEAAAGTRAGHRVLLGADLGGSNPRGGRGRGGGVKAECSAGRRGASRLGVRIPPHPGGRPVTLTRGGRAGPGRAAPGAGGGRCSGAQAEGDSDSQPPPPAPRTHPLRAARRPRPPRARPCSALGPPRRRLPLRSHPGPSPAPRDPLRGVVWRGADRRTDTRSARRTDRGGRDRHGQAQWPTVPDGHCARSGTPRQPRAGPAVSPGCYSAAGLESAHVPTRRASPPLASWRGCVCGVNPGSGAPGTRGAPEDEGPSVGVKVHAWDPEWEEVAVTRGHPSASGWRPAG